jgi:phosphatidate cytidylyltransferase
MLRTRLWMGAVLIGLAAVLLLEDRWFAPWYPVLLVCYLGAVFVAARELLQLLPDDVRPTEWLTVGFTVLIGAMNWWSAVREPGPFDAWHLVGGCVVAGTVVAFLREMWRFEGPNQLTIKIALTTFTLVYLGILPSFLAQLRWLPSDRSTVALALAVFVPKCNDIGAYFTGKFLTGRILGRTPMTPVLSPKKTVQGGVGGMLTSVGVAVGVQANWPVIPGGWVGAVALGLIVGLAGILGDLAESLIKRDVQAKDASQAIPGFGGVLDVVDSLLFAAPMVYLWFIVGPFLPV